MELQQIIYDTLLNQIQFGNHRYMEGLASINEVSEYFHVSVDTVQSAYRRLKKEGYISLSKNVGAKVAVSYDDDEIKQNIQTFFSHRKDAILDLSYSAQLLLGHIQWLGLKHAAPETLKNMELLYKRYAAQPIQMWQYIEQRYPPLGNAILVRLARQLFLFFQGPFFSVITDKNNLDKGAKGVQGILGLCRQKDWQGLQNMLDYAQNDLCTSLHQFYRERISMPVPENQIPFRWSSYKKPGQLCYSLTIELLTNINRGIYPPGSLMPTMEHISREKGISVSTVRRAVSLLVSIGAVKSSRPYGMRVLPIMESSENCDFSRPDIRQRLIAMLESLQIFALSCRAIAEVTLSFLDSDTIKTWKMRLSALLDSSCFDVLSYVVLELLTDSVPSRVLHTVYKELLEQLFWGNSLRGMKGDREAANALLYPYLTGFLTLLENIDIPGFCRLLEEFLIYELRDTVKHLIYLGIQEAENILIPEKDEMNFCNEFCNEFF